MEVISMTTSHRNLLQRLDNRWALAALPLALAAVLSTNPAAAQTTSPATNVTASATVVTPLTISSASALNFGTFASGSSAGTVVLSPASARSSTGGVTLVATNSGTATTVSLAGAGGTAFTLNYPSTTINLTGPGTAMTLSNFTTSLTGTGLGGTGVGGTMPSSGTLSFTVGGTLNVGASQVAGSYSGTFPLTITYQ
jgi:hypothetical protein